jgi:hypothetical protein
MHQEPDILGGVSRRGEPTSASPGSERKIRILIERAARKEPLFHPEDGLKNNLLAPGSQADNPGNRMESA